MKVYWAIAAGLLVAGPIMVLPSPRSSAAASSAPHHMVVKVEKLGIGKGVEIGR